MKVLKSLLYSLALLAYSNLLFAQDEDFPFIDYTYQDYLCAVKFHPNGLALSYPIVDLNTDAQLKFSFDDLEGDVKDYLYTLIHCDADWKRSALNELEYMDGFTEARIKDFQYSFNTVVQYTHYDLLLPNDDVRVTKSGNYLLVVYDDSNDKKVVMTRRFMVIEPLIKMTARANGASDVSKIRTHQEVDFKVNHEGVQIRNPLIEVQATVLQNGKWDNAIIGIKPLFIRQNELSFDYQNTIVFPAGNEFRPIDMRDLNQPINNIFSIERFDDRHDVTLEKDSSRYNQPYLYIKDLNGQFVIEHYSKRDADLRCDYAEVLFSYYASEPFNNGDLYLYGAFSDWTVKPTFKMVYNPIINCYVAKVPLKEGYYNYAYAFVPKKGKPLPETLYTEGSWYDTSNDYIILVYQRPFGSRYDKIIGAYLFDSGAR
ncbi:MAG: DUF5103 domain-containing protein [Saprospiraceae bacterium]|nr:DUF5103 domain-containing protein [Saprospiraceae bacterium]